jgi:hypothetical protein
MYIRNFTFSLLEKWYDLTTHHATRKRTKNKNYRIGERSAQRHTSHHITSHHRKNAVGLNRIELIKSLHKESALAYIHLYIHRNQQARLVFTAVVHHNKGNTIACSFLFSLPFVYSVWVIWEDRLD